MASVHNATLTFNNQILSFAVEIRRHCICGFTLRCSNEAHETRDSHFGYPKITARSLFVHL